MKPNRYEYQTKPKRNWRRVTRHFTVACFLLAACFASVKLVERLSVQMVPAEALSEFSLDLSTEIFDRKGRKIGEIAGKQRYFVAVDTLPEQLVQAFLAAEDRDFYSHNGISLSGIARAAFSNVRNMRVVQGGSTITQQLARLYFLNQEKTLARKVKEALLAMAIEQRFTKDRILELYLNKIYLGANTYGVEAAARRYFAKGAAHLNLAEAAMLAGLPKAPSKYAPHRFFGKAKKRQELVLGRMARAGFVAADVANRWKKHTVKIAKQPLEKTKFAPYFVDAVRHEVERRLELGALTTKGLRIDTTLDLDEQRTTRKLLSASLKKWQQTIRKPKDRLQVAALSMDPGTGAVSMMRGGDNFDISEYNRAIFARRPVGSLFLPVFYAVALDRGFSLASSLFDLRHKQMGEGPGDMTLYEGLIAAKTFESSRLLAWLGLGTVREFSHQLGLRFLRKDLSLALGRGKASLKQMMEVYALFANKGIPVPGHLVNRVRENNGNVLFQRQAPAGVRLLTEQSAYIMTEGLKHAVRFGAARAARIAGESAWGMLGTDKSLHDAWFVGYCNNRLLGIWVGSEHGKTKIGISEEQVRDRISRLWKRVMLALPKGEKLKLDIPPGISYARFPIATGGRSKSLPFRSGTEPF